jgi:hypothetical protein
MRFLILTAALSITACAKEEEAVAPALATGTYAGGGRDALCVAGQGGARRGGFVVYGADDANCSASGRIEQVGAAWNLIPAGDLDCKIALSVNAGRVSLGPRAPACAYYCGPDASWDGKSFGPVAQGKPVTDLAGEPLC